MRRGGKALSPSLQSPVGSPHNYSGVPALSLNDLDEMAGFPFSQPKVTSPLVSFIHPPLQTRTHISCLHLMLFHLLGKISRSCPSYHLLSWRCGGPADLPCLSSVPSFLSSGVDSARVRQAVQIAGQSSTRRLGDYRVKFNYNEIDLLRWRQNTRITSDVRLLYRLYEGLTDGHEQELRIESSCYYQDICSVLLKGGRLKTIM